MKKVSAKCGVNSVVKAEETEKRSKGYKCRTLVAVTRTMYMGVPHPDNCDMESDTGPVTCCLSRKQGT